MVMGKLFLWFASKHSNKLISSISSVGIVEFTSPSFIKEQNPQLLAPDFNISSLRVIECKTFPEILDSLIIKHLDVYVLDVEGAEMSALEGMTDRVFTNIPALAAPNINSISSKSGSAISISGRTTALISAVFYTKSF